MQKCIHVCIIIQASAQECRRAWPGSSANIRREKRENVAQLARVAAADSVQAGGRWRSAQSVAEKLAGMVQAGGIVCNGCSWPCVIGSSANVSSAAAGLSWLKRWRRWWYVCRITSRITSKTENRSVLPALGLANSSGVYVARGLSWRDVGMRGLCVTLCNVYSVGGLRLRSTGKANTSDIKAARLYVWGFHVMRCIYGGIYGRTYDALLFVHGIGWHNGRGIIHALLLHALAVCQRVRRIDRRGI